MVPPPTWDHQDITTELTIFLGAQCTRLRLGRMCVQAGVHDPADPDRNYRVPDLTFVARGNEQVIRRRGVVGAADLVLEVRSPDDESYEKLPFYARLGIPAVLIIDRDTKRPELFRLAGAEYQEVAAGAGGWLVIEELQIRLRRTPRGRKLVLESQDNAAVRAEI
ncbi:MAG: Uma2 family endonuclease [Planctomycetes bacterium]|nr:Uma2 family endonuclease [Planctomycetota bacterium]